MSDYRLAWFIIALLGVAIAAQIHAGKIRLYMAPRAWKHVDRQSDPGRFWAFVTAEGIVMLLLIVQATVAKLL